MPVIGTHVDSGPLQSLRISGMNRSTVNKSVDRLQEMVKDRTPVDENGPHPGKLRNSVKKTKAHRNRRRRWQAEVYSDLDYAPHVEYGTSPHPITPKKARALAWQTAAGTTAFSAGHWVKGYKGAHMFQRAAADFSAKEAEAIAKTNARLWLMTPGFRPTFVSVDTRGRI